MWLTLSLLPKTVVSTFIIIIMASREHIQKLSMKKYITETTKTSSSFLSRSTADVTDMDKTEMMIVNKMKNATLSPKFSVIGTSEHMNNLEPVLNGGRTSTVVVMQRRRAYGATALGDSNAVHDDNYNIIIHIINSTSPYTWTFILMCTRSLTHSCRMQTIWSRIWT